MLKYFKIISSFFNLVGDAIVDIEGVEPQDVEFLETVRKAIDGAIETVIAAQKNPPTIV